MKKLFFLTLLCVVLGCKQTEKKEAPNHPPKKEQREKREKRKRRPVPKGELPKATIALKNIVYKNIDTTQLKLDIYKPQTDAKKLPLLVWIHGGAWMRGDKEAFIGKNNNLVKALLKEGYAIASVNYRLSGEAIFPAQIQDCNDAISFLYKNAKEYGIDKDKIAVMGRSAGGHLAGLVATSNAHKIAEFYKNPSEFKIRALVDFFGPSDLVNFKEGKKRTSKKSPEAKLLGDAPANIPQKAEKASPVTYVNAETPPTILLHGTADKNVPSKQSEVFKSALDKAEVTSELYLAENARHGDPIFDTEAYVTKVITFLQKHFPTK